MSTEEKAKAYDELLVKAKQYLKDCPDRVDAKGCMEYLFPELAETDSEDEKIRKLLVAYFAKFKPDDMWDSDFSVGDILAWLEKQGEQKPENPLKSDRLFREGVEEVIKHPTDYGLQKQGEQKPILKEQDPCENCTCLSYCGSCEHSEHQEIKRIEEAMQKSVIPKFRVGEKIVEKAFDECSNGTITEIKDGKYFFNDGSFINIEEQDLWQTVEQKPVEWSEEDERMLEAATRSCEQCGNYYVTNWLKSLKDRCIPQPKQEWSEEDEEKLRCIKALTNGKIIDGYSQNDLINWIESLRPQPKQEWTKEDIDMIDWLIRCCEKEHEELCNDRYGHQDIVSDLKRDCRKKWDWLESLKEKVAPQKQWKPSEEQMMYLSEAIDAVTRAEKFSIVTALKELIEQLKKLREEQL